MIPVDDPSLEENGYNFAYLDEQTKRAIRRALLKAVAIPGFQVPFASTEIPLSRGWGTGGIQITASIIGRSDILKVIDQGADDATNPVNIRSFFKRVAHVATTTHTREATIIQTRHRIPEEPLGDRQILVLQVPNPEPLRRLTPRLNEATRMHAFADYSSLYVLLYEDISRHGQIATSYDYPVKVNGRFISSPSPIPKFDNPKLNRNRALLLFGAGRERRLYAFPPFTLVESLQFRDYPFTPQRWDEGCHLCGSASSYLDEIVQDDQGTRRYVCSDTDFCQQRQEEAKSSDPEPGVPRKENLYHE